MLLGGATIGGQLRCNAGTFRNRTGDGGGVALSGVAADIAGSVYLCDHFTAEGAVRLLDASISGQLDCSEGTFQNRTDDGSGVALAFDRAHVAGDVFFEEGFSAEGEVRLLAAKIGGQLNCAGGKFHNRTNDASGAAFSCDDANVSGSVLLSDGFAAEGQVRLLGANIGGDLACAGGTFDNSIAAPHDPQTTPTGRNQTGSCNSTNRRSFVAGACGRAKQPSCNHSRRTQSARRPCP